MLLKKTWSRLLLALMLLGLSGAALVMTASFLYLSPQLPAAAQLREVTFQIPLRVYSRDGDLIGEYGEQRRTPIAYEDIPTTFINAITSAEDERFFRHNGVDLRGLARAVTELVRYREIRSGGSTITMQVARNFFLSRDQTFLRKFNEIVLSLQIEKLLTKEEILELYVNKIYLGHRAYGIEAAAHVYYGKRMAELNLAQMAMIAGLPKAPSAYNPLSNPRRALARRDWILERMHDRGVISDEDYEIAHNAPITARHHGSRPEVEGSYVAEMARQEALRQFGPRIYTDGIRVTTTLDSTMQRAAVSSLRHSLHAYDERHGWRGAEARVAVDDLPALPAAAEELDASDTDAQEASDTEEAPPQAVTLSGIPTSIAAWARELRGYRRIGELDPALVAEVGDQEVRLVLSTGQIAKLPWEQMKWARPYINASAVGAAPEKPADVLSPGDIVRLRAVASDEGNKVWRLAQLPTAQAALVAVDPQTGAIRALQGGYSFAQSNYNRALQAERQAGSAIKPFVYAAGIERGITAATLINDAPVVFQDSQLESAWRPTGAGTRFYGPTRVREALYRSLNLVSIRLLQQVGIGNTMATLNEFGLPTRRFARDLSLALGSATVTPLEMASAYAVFANGGHQVPPWFIERIEDEEGEVLWQAPRIHLCDADECDVLHEPLPVDIDALTETALSETGMSEDGDLVEPVPPPLIEWRPRTVDARTVWLMDSIMKDVIRRGTAGSARALNRSDLAGKTGSTNDHLDAWFAGYAPGLASVAWVGFDSPATLGRGEYGGRAALPMWIDFMSGSLPLVPERSLPQPPGIVSARINPDSGKRARPGDQGAIFEYFREEDLPELDDESRSGSGSGDDQISPEDLF
ncbi:MAG: PBP1A family penicillin-binding protein [Alcanivorax sp.]|nr:PBP1A family penicillin-binding protein [Alcanivorax sp.]